VRLVDWRDRSLPSFDAIWEGETRRWLDRLGWNSRDNWELVERQRREQQLPGLALIDGDAIVAWTFFVVQHGTLQVGGFDAASAAAAEQLVHAIDVVAEPAIAPDGVLFFVFSDAPGLTAALGRREFAVEPYLYFVGDRSAEESTDSGFEWEPAAQAQLSSLFARAYGPPSLTRPFVRHDAPDEWLEYTTRLVQAHACGRFEPPLSAASLSADGTLQAAVLTTAIDRATAHVAQVGVDPSVQGRGVGEAMLRTVLSRAAAAGYRRVSLLVGEGNVRARALYARLGFVERARFLSAGRPGYPRLSTSPAADTGGASTRR
jgi:ribosomal protein S18 acetylase RimI-like enzyme